MMNTTAEITQIGFKIDALTGRLDATRSRRRWTVSARADCVVTLIRSIKITTGTRLEILNATAVLQTTGSGDRNTVLRSHRGAEHPVATGTADAWHRLETGPTLPAHT